MTEARDPQSREERLGGRRTGRGGFGSTELLKGTDAVAQRDDAQNGGGREKVHDRAVEEVVLIVEIRTVAAAASSRKGVQLFCLDRDE